MDEAPDDFWTRPLEKETRCDAKYSVENLARQQRDQSGNASSQRARIVTVLEDIRTVLWMIAGLLFGLSIKVFW